MSISLPVIRFTAIGNRDFPLDMLRHDACWPSDSDSAWRIADTRREIADKLIPYEIHLLSHREPTAERWQSFSWSVVVNRE